MKKITCLIFSICSAFAFAFFAPAALAAPVYASNTSHSVSEMKFTDVIISVLYFIGALLLIYLVLTLVSRWGKKHPDKDERKDGEEKNGKTEAEAGAPKKGEPETEESTSEKQENRNEGEKHE